MKYIIESVLRRHQDRQVDLKDPRARTFLAEEIAIVLTESVTDFGEEPQLEIPERDPQTGQKNPLYGMRARIQES